MSSKIKIYIHGCLIFSCLQSVLCAMEPMSRPGQEEQGNNLKEELQEVAVITALLKSSTDELIKDSIHFKPENEELFLTARLKVSKVTVNLLEKLELTYKCRQKFTRKEIERIDALLKNPTVAIEVRKLLQTQRVDLFKTLKLLEEKKKESYVRLIELYRKENLLYSKILLLNKAVEQMEEDKPDGVEKGVNQKNLSEDYLDKETNELTCSIQ
ncbi:hypothetical protein H0X06_04450 [Candidatus Dependentiae bacterium]|nr:hypothetical protein [Candidatus Dependentiae bacterium]